MDDGPGGRCRRRLGTGLVVEDDEHFLTKKETIKELLTEKQPSEDFATLAQLGGTVAFLCSAAADQITGTAISVDGGWTAQ
jgi:3-hydroxybutyrate dehydrogenase